MPIQTNCPDCGNAATVPDNLLGKRVRCPSCKQPFTVKAPEPLADEITDVEAAALRAPASKKRPLPRPPDDEDESERRPPPNELVPPAPGSRFKKQKQVPSVMSRELTAGLIFLAVSCCCSVGGGGVWLIISFATRAAMTDMVNKFDNKVDTPQNDEQLTKALQAADSGDGGRRNNAFEAIARANVIERRRKEVTDKALANVQDGAARNVVKKWAGKDSVPDLINLLDHNDGGVRHMALETLGKLKDERSVAPVALRLGPDREHASKALQAMGPMAERGVIPYLKDGDAGVRRESCMVLKRIGGPASIDALQTLQSTERDNGVKTAARDAIGTIQGRLKG
jgi:hypothetical protein